MFGGVGLNSNSNGLVFLNICYLWCLARCK